MRRLTSKQEYSKKQKRNQIILGGILVLILILSTAGYALMGNESDEEKNYDKLQYNGNTFLKQGNYWYLVKNGNQFVFKKNPNQVEKINSEIKLIDNYSGKPLYIFAENKEAESEIAINLQNIALRIQEACYIFDGEEECGDLPVKTCADNFIIIKEAAEMAIIQEENCAFIYGPRENLTQVADEFLFKTIGVEQ
jgi:hypothetical protein